jgi:hypothetical protein
MRAAGAEGRIMRRKSAGGREQPGSARVPRFGGSFRPGFVARRASQLTEHRPRSRVPGSNRAHLENVGQNATHPAGEPAWREDRSRRSASRFGTSGATRSITASRSAEDQSLVGGMRAMMVGSPSLAKATAKLPTEVMIDRADHGSRTCPCL